jgi:hypothetical protein
MPYTALLHPLPMHGAMPYAICLTMQIAWGLILGPSCVNLETALSGMTFTAMTPAIMLLQASLSHTNANIWGLKRWVRLPVSRAEAGTGRLLARLPETQRFRRLPRPGKLASKDC